MPDRGAEGTPADVVARLQEKALRLDAMATEERGFGNSVTEAHLSGKAEGVRLAISVMKETWSV